MSNETIRLFYIKSAFKVLFGLLILPLGIMFIGFYTRPKYDNLIIRISLNPKSKFKFLINDKYHYHRTILTFIICLFAFPLLFYFIGFWYRPFYERYKQKADLTSLSRQSVMESDNKNYGQGVVEI